MDTTEVLDKLLRSFEAYYNVKRDGAEAPFVAEAEFSLHDAQYFLVKSVRLGEADSKEYVYFATVDTLDADTLRDLDETAWTRGSSRVVLHPNHKNTDVTLIVLADQIEKEAFSLVPKLRHHKSYSFGFRGWSNYRLIAVELSSRRMAYNRQGQSLKKLVSNII